MRRRGATILVEGVETGEQLALALDVDEAQGYHLGRPAGIEAPAPCRSSGAEATFAA